MKEELISLETALAAKEKGFKPFQCKGCYSSNGKYTLLDGYKGYVEKQGEIGKVYNSDVVLEENKIPVVEQHHLQQWLREEHTIDTAVIPIRFTGYDDVGYYTYAVKSIQPVGKQKYKFNTWEEALEAGLQKALTLI